MSKKKSQDSPSNAERRRRKRRSAEEIIADLQEEIRRVRARAIAKELKQSPAYKAAISAVRALDKALAAAADESNTAMRHALATGRKELGTYLEEHGLRLPKARLPKGPRPRGGKAG